MNTEIKTPTLVVILAVIALIIGAVAWKATKPPTMQVPPGYSRGGARPVAP